MKIKIYETRNLNLDTVEKMLIMTDKHVNFNPETYWILCSSDGEDIIHDQKEGGFTKRYKWLFVKWHGREAVIDWLVSNQILFEVTSQELLQEEREALGEDVEDSYSELKPILIN